MRKILQEALTYLARSAVQSAATGARAYLDANRLVADPDALTMLIKRHVHGALKEAVKDAREALESNMIQIAGTTFTLSMVQAGINAAKEAVALAKDSSFGEWLEHNRDSIRTTGVARPDDKWTSVSFPASEGSALPL